MKTTLKLHNLVLGAIALSAVFSADSTFAGAIYRCSPGTYSDSPCGPNEKQKVVAWSSDNPTPRQVTEKGTDRVATAFAKQELNQAVSAEAAENDFRDAKEQLARSYDLFAVEYGVPEKVKGNRRNFARYADKMYRLQQKVELQEATYQQKKNALNTIRATFGRQPVVESVDAPQRYKQALAGWQDIVKEVGAGEIAKISESYTEAFMQGKAMDMKAKENARDA